MSVMMITALPNKMAGRGHLAWPALGASPYISHYLCMIGQLCDENSFAFLYCGPVLRHAAEPTQGANCRSSTAS